MEFCKWFFITGARLCTLGGVTSVAPWCLFRFVSFLLLLSSFLSFFLSLLVFRTTLVMLS